MCTTSNAPPPTVPTAAVPWLAVDQMREVDRIMVSEVGVDLARMMENAGRSLAVASRWMLGGAHGRRVLVLAGPGGNGGGGMAAARHLHVAGAVVEVCLSAPRGRLGVVPAQQLGILEAIGVPVCAGTDTGPEWDLLIDAVLGYGQTGPPRGAAAELVRTCAGRRTLSLAAPSGLELESGLLHDPSVRAEVTLTLAAPKAGLRSSPAVGRLLLADISVPPLVWRRIGVEPPDVFGAGPVVEIIPT